MLITSNLSAKDLNAIKESDFLENYEENMQTLLHGKLKLNKHQTITLLYKIMRYSISQGYDECVLKIVRYIFLTYKDLVCENDKIKLFFKNIYAILWNHILELTKSQQLSENNAIYLGDYFLFTMIYSTIVGSIYIPINDIFEPEKFKEITEKIFWFTKILVKLKITFNITQELYDNLGLNMSIVENLIYLSYNSMFAIYSGDYGDINQAIVCIETYLDNIAKDIVCAHNIVANIATIVKQYSIILNYHTPLLNQLKTAIYNKLLQYIHGDKLDPDSKNHDIANCCKIYLKLSFILTPNANIAESCDDWKIVLKILNSSKVAQQFSPSSDWTDKTLSLCLLNAIFCIVAYMQKTEFNLKYITNTNTWLFDIENYEEIFISQIFDIICVLTSTSSTVCEILVNRNAISHIIPYFLYKLSDNGKMCQIEIPFVNLDSYYKKVQSNSPKLDLAKKSIVEKDEFLNFLPCNSLYLNMHVLSSSMYKSNLSLLKNTVSFYNFDETKCKIQLSPEHIYKFIKILYNSTLRIKMSITYVNFHTVKSNIECPVLISNLNGRTLETMFDKFNVCGKLCNSDLYANIEQLAKLTNNPEYKIEAQILQCWPLINSEEIAKNYRDVQRGLRNLERMIEKHYPKNSESIGMFQHFACFNLYHLKFLSYLHHYILPKVKTPIPLSKMLFDISKSENDGTFSAIQSKEQIQKLLDMAQEFRICHIYDLLDWLEFGLYHLESYINLLMKTDGFTNRHLTHENQAILLIRLQYIKSLSQLYGGKSSTNIRLSICMFRLSIVIISKENNVYAHIIKKSNEISNNTQMFALLIACLNNLFEDILLFEQYKITKELSTSLMKDLLLMQEKLSLKPLKTTDFLNSNIFQHSDYERVKFHNYILICQILTLIENKDSCFDTVKPLILELKCIEDDITAIENGHYTNYIIKCKMQLHFAHVKRHITSNLLTYVDNLIAINYLDSNTFGLNKSIIPPLLALDKTVSVKTCHVFKSLASHFKCKTPQKRNIKDITSSDISNDMNRSFVHDGIYHMARINILCKTLQSLEQLAMTYHLLGYVRESKTYWLEAMNITQKYFNPLRFLNCLFNVTMCELREGNLSAILFYFTIYSTLITVDNNDKNNNKFNQKFMSDMINHNIKTIKKIPNRFDKRFPITIESNLHTLIKRVIPCFQKNLSFVQHHIYKDWLILISYLNKYFNLPSIYSILPIYSNELKPYFFEYSLMKLNDKTTNFQLYLTFLSFRQYVSRITSILSNSNDLNNSYKISKYPHFKKLNKDKFWCIQLLNLVSNGKISPFTYNNLLPKLVLKQISFLYSSIIINLKNQNNSLVLFQFNFEEITFILIHIILGVQKYFQAHHYVKEPLNNIKQPDNTTKNLKTAKTNSAFDILQSQIYALTINNNTIFKSKSTTTLKRAELLKVRPVRKKGKNIISNSTCKNANKIDTSIITPYINLREKSQSLNSLYNSLPRYSHVEKSKYVSCALDDISFNYAYPFDNKNREGFVHDNHTDNKSPLPDIEDWILVIQTLKQHLTINPLHPHTTLVFKYLAILLELKSFITNIIMPKTQAPNKLVAKKRLPKSAVITNSTNDYTVETMDCENDKIISHINELYMSSIFPIYNRKFTINDKFLRPSENSQSINITCNNQVESQIIVMINKVAIGQQQYLRLSRWESHNLTTPIIHYIDFPKTTEKALYNDIHRILERFKNHIEIDNKVKALHLRKQLNEEFKQCMDNLENILKPWCHIFNNQFLLHNLTSKQSLILNDLITSILVVKKENSMSFPHANTLNQTHSCKLFILNYLRNFLEFSTLTDVAAFLKRFQETFYPSESLNVDLSLVHKDAILKLMLQLKEEMLKMYYTEDNDNSNTSINLSPIYLILESDLHYIPWESLDMLINKPIYRMIPYSSNNNPNVHFSTNPQINLIDFTKCFYILNPYGDLEATEKLFLPIFNSFGWNGISNTKPDNDTFLQALENHDLFVYCGHGSGSSFLKSLNSDPGFDQTATNAKLSKCANMDCGKKQNAVTCLMGCSSAKLNQNGEFEANGNLLTYLLSGCPTLIGCLWDVTSNDLDRYFNHLLQTWIQNPDKPLGLLVQEARTVCKLPWLVGAALVIYGVPFSLERQSVIPIVSSKFNNVNSIITQQTNICANTSNAKKKSNK